jgi:hypothetical protein
MGLRTLLDRLLRRKQRSPLDEARAAARALSRKGHVKRRKHPPRPDERSIEPADWAGYSSSDSAYGGGASGGD